VILRTSHSGDLSAIKEIEGQCHLSSWTIEDYKSAQSDPEWVLLVVEGNGRIIGFALSRLISDSVDTGTVELLNIAIRPEHRRRGLALRLLRETIELSKCESGTVELELRSGNSEALAFYTKIGFIEVGRRVAYYSKPAEDAVLMNLKFTRPK